MSSQALQTRGVAGTMQWLEASGGHLTRRERWAYLPGLGAAFLEGLGLWRAARKSGRRDVALSAFEPPDTPMVRDARGFLAAHSLAPMVNHCHRTAFWTLAVLNQHLELTPQHLETAWVAALLHDVGLELPPERGDFSARGVEVLRRFAREHRWPEEQVHLAGEAIATNLSAQVDPARSGMIAWAMNVGGLAELGFGPHRSQLAPGRVRTLEQRYPRDGFRELSTRLIADEARRLPDGRSAFFRYIFPLLMKR